MNILFAASEAAPFCKSGGLGDVMEALPAELSKKNDVFVSVFVPYYKSIKENPDIETEYIKSFYVQVAWRSAYVGIFRVKNGNEKLQYYFIDNEQYFNRNGMYGYYDDGERFTYFSIAVLESMRQLQYFPDVVHCNDWQTALIPVLKKALYAGMFDNTRTVYTIHNIEYQGKMPNEFMQDVIGIDEFWRNMLTCENCINLMKGAIITADKITTVSKTYAHEIQHAYFAHGLQGVLNENAYKTEGITNGLHIELYDPSEDTDIFEKFSAIDISGKARNKEELQKMLKLPIRSEVPIIAMISRLVPHKGLDLVEYVMGEIVQKNIQFVIVGTGDKKYEDMFNFNAHVHPDKVSSNITFNSSLAKKTYAGADMFLMPSKSEPCGLSQLIAMRYGTVPIVRETGGLVDTVPPLDINTLEGKGFTFKTYNAFDMLGAIDRCIDFYSEKDKWNNHVKNLIGYNRSWENAVQDYYRIYKEIL